MQILFDQISKLKISSSNNIVQIMSWNLLSDDYCKVKKYPYIKQLQYLKYEYRLTKIKQKIIQASCTILCLQEVDNRQQFIAFLQQKGYGVVYKPTRNYGLMIAFKKGEFDLLKVGIINFDDFIYPKFKQQIYKKGHTALWVRLKMKSGQNIFVVTTQIFWNPSFQKVKYFQTSCLLNEVYRLKQSTDKLIIAGDFNSLPHHNSIKLIEEGSKPEKQRCVRANQNYQDMLYVYNQHKSKLKLQATHDQEDGRYTNYTHQFKGKIDYIYYECDQFIVQYKNSLQTQEQLSQQIGLPNWRLPSDHIPLIAHLQFQ